MGPKPTLLALARGSVPGDGATWLPTLRPGAEWLQLLAALGALYEQGRDVRWDRFDADYQPSRVLLPTYPFERKRYWVGGAVPSSAPQADRSRAIQVEQTGGDANAWLHRVEWQPAPLRAAVDPGRATESTRPWLILGDRHGLALALAETLRQRGVRSVTAVCDQSIVRTDDGRVFAAATPDELEQSVHALIASERGLWQGLIHLWALDNRGAGEAAPGDGWRASAAALFAAQRFVDAAPAGRVVFVTRHAVPLSNGSAAVRCEDAGIWGLARTLRVEHPEMRCVTIDLDADDRSVADRLLAEIVTESDDREIAYRGGTRVVPRLRPLAGTSSSDRPRPSFEEGAYLITGGSGGLGVAVAEWLVARGARDVVLASRRPPANLALASTGTGARRIRAVSADVTNPEQVRELVAAVRAGGQRLRGVVHAAGP